MDRSGIFLRDRLNRTAIALEYDGTKEIKVTSGLEQVSG